MFYCCIEENMKVLSELRVSLCRSLCKHTAKREHLGKMWLKRASGQPKEAGAVPARRWNNSPKGWAIPEYSGAGRKQTHSLNRSLGSEKSCWRWTGFKVINPEDLQLYEGHPCSMPQGRCAASGTVCPCFPVYPVSLSKGFFISVLFSSKWQSLW